MQSMNHQMMGYDRAITMFSPDGRLLQVEYAKKTVKQGSTAVGMVCKDGVVLVTDKRIVDPLMVANSVDKIVKVDDHINITASGILSDARILIERAQLKAQQHFVTYDSRIDILSIVKDLANLKQICTQSGGLRPFGVSLLIAGVDSNGPVLYETDPTGIFFEYYAAVIGEGETEIEETLQKEYKKEMSCEDAIKVAVRAMDKILEGFDETRCDIMIVDAKSAKSERLDNAKIKKILSDARKK